jgi:acyl-CoA thioesterase YciA
MELVMKKMCYQKDLGRNKNLFGGTMMSWMDEAASIYAYQHCEEERMVTLRYGEYYFRKQVKQGDIIEFFCGNEKKGNTSFTFDIMAIVRGSVVFSTDCTFVAIDEKGNKKAIDKFQG